MRITTISALGLALLAVVAPQRARAVEPLDTASFRIGGYITSWDTEVRADGQTARGTDVDLEKDFGIDDSSTIGYVGFTWRPWEAHEFGLTYYQNDGDATRHWNTMQRKRHAHLLELCDAAGAITAAVGPNTSARL